MAFDRDYYQRFYFNPRTAVTSRAEMHARARLIVGYVQYVGLPVARILDAGCGVGPLRAPLRRAWRAADYVGLEFSEYLCRRDGWRDNCDQSRTDRIPGLRRGAWYRRELARAFRPLGCGMWLKRGLPVTLWNLDVCAN